MRKLTGQVAIITGGANGIGKATAGRFAREGASVIIWDVDQANGQKVVKHLTEQGANAVFNEVNICDLDSVMNAAASVNDKFGRIDILINNAGIVRDSSLLKMTENQFDQVIDVNLKGTFNCTKTVAPFMVERKHGRIIQTTSIVAVNGNFGQTNYVASKAGIVGMTKVWAKELGRKGITVNAVAPGFIETEMLATIPEDHRSKMREMVPLLRLGNAAEVAGVFLFLVSEDASFINGAVIHVDGGAVV